MIGKHTLCRAFCALVLVLGTIRPALAQPTYDAVSSSSAAAASTLTFAHAIGSGTNRALYCGISTGGNATAITSVTWNGNAGTELYDDASTPSFAAIALYRWKDASLSNASANVVVTAGGSTDISAACISVAGVDQTTTDDGVDSANTDTGVTANSIASATGDLVIEFAGMGDPASATTANTERSDTYNGTSNILIVSQTAAGAATVTLDWTPNVGASWYRSVAVNVNSVQTELISPSFAAQNTTATNDMSADGYNWAAEQPIVVDQYGKVILLAQRQNGGSKRHVFVVSNDNAATWSEPTISGFYDASGEGFVERAAIAYDSTNDLVHALWRADSVTDGMIYRRYSFTRDGSNNITAVTRVSGVNLQLDIESTGTMNYQHPMIFWFSSGGAAGQVLCLWTARNTGTGSGTNKNEIRASRRVLSNTTADNTAGNWVAPVSADSTGIGNAPVVAYSVIVQNNNGAINYFSAGHKTTGTNAGDIYVVYWDGNVAGTPGYLFRRMRWASGSSNWSTGLSTATAIANAVIAGTDTGYSLKYQIQSQVTEDTDNDRMYVGLALWVSNTAGDTCAFYSISSTDTVGTRVDVYSAGGAHSLFPTLDMYYDAAANRLVYIYQKTSSEDFYMKLYDSSHTVTQAEYAVKTGIDLDVPLIYPGRFNSDKLLVVFRDHVGGAAPYDGWAGTLTWQIGNGGAAASPMGMILTGVGR